MTYAPPRAGRARQRQDAACDGPWPPAVRAALRPGGATGRQRRLLRARAAEAGLACQRLRRALAVWRRAWPQAPPSDQAAAAAMVAELHHYRARAVAARDRLGEASGDDT